MLLAIGMNAKEKAMGSTLKISIEEYWQELRMKELPHVVPFNRPVFDQTLQTVKQMAGLSKLDFVIDCLDKDVESSSFRSFLQSLSTREDTFYFADGYTTVTITMIAAQLLAYHGQEACNNYLADVGEPLQGLILEHIENIAKQIQSEPTGYSAIEYLKQQFTAITDSDYFDRGILAAHDTFIAYSKVLDKYVAIFPITAVAEQEKAKNMLKRPINQESLITNQKIPEVIPNSCGECKFFGKTGKIDFYKGYCSFYNKKVYSSFNCEALGLLTAEVKVSRGLIKATQSAENDNVIFENTFDYAQNLQELPNSSVIKAIIIDNAISRAIGSLCVWGAINLGAWFYFKEDIMSTFGKINAPAGTFNTLIYGGAVIGICMIIFGVIGVATRSSIVGWLNGISLLVVGGWNVAHDFILIAALKPYGYTVDSSGPHFWIILGIAQLIWGGKQLFQFGAFGKRPTSIPPSAKVDAQEKLKQIMMSPASPDTGRLKFSISSQSFPFFIQKTEEFTMWLLPERAYCLENGLNRFLEFERHELMNKQFSKQKVGISDIHGMVQNIVFDESSLSAFNKWLQN